MMAREEEEEEEEREAEREDIGHIESVAPSTSLHNVVSLAAPQPVQCVTLLSASVRFSLLFIFYGVTPIDRTVE